MHRIAANTADAEQITENGHLLKCVEFQTRQNDVLYISGVGSPYKEHVSKVCGNLRRTCVVLAWMSLTEI